VHSFRRRGARTAELRGGNGIAIAATNDPLTFALQGGCEMRPFELLCRQTHPAVPVTVSTICSSICITPWSVDQLFAVSDLVAYHEAV